MNVTSLWNLEILTVLHHAPGQSSPPTFLRNSAVDRTRITSLEKLRDVWKAAESLHARTPKSFTFRMSKVLTQVRQQLRKLSDMQSDMQWMSLGFLPCVDP